MFPSIKNTTSFWNSKNVKVEDKLSYPFGSYPKPQISDLVVLAAYPFGSILSSVSKGVYRYGMNTQEKDNEIYGEGNSYSAEYWQYDARLGRRWNVDPVVKVHESPYATFANNPVWFVDPNGADWFVSNEKGSKDEPVWLPSEDNATNVFGKNGFVSLGENVLPKANVSANGNGSSSNSNYNVPSYLINAKGEYGQKEIKGSEHNPRILEYHSTTTDGSTGKPCTTDEAAWCASFINWNVTQVGLSSNDNPYSANAWSYKNNTNVSKIDKPALGAITLLKNIETGDMHVTFIIGVNGNTIHGYGGNQRDQVKVSSYPDSEYKVTGYYMPIGVTPNYNLPTIKHNFNTNKSESTR
jgi:uncharacterized protein (TIGR02594 family)